MTKSYSLDTSTCIDLIRGKVPSVRVRFKKAVETQQDILISSIVLHELAFGANRSRGPGNSFRALEDFLTGVTVINFDADDAISAGQIRANLTAAGKVIGPFDCLIAAQALRRKLTVVTGNKGEFSRVAGLAVERW